MVNQTEGLRDTTQYRGQSRGGEEARTADTVCTASSPSCRIELIICRCLEDIERRSQALVEKGKKGWIPRMLDKTQASQAVVKLVEDLRQAILIYQVATVGYYWDWRVLTCWNSYRNSNR